MTCAAAAADARAVTPVEVAAAPSGGLLLPRLLLLLVMRMIVLLQWGFSPLLISSAAYVKFEVNVAATAGGNDVFLVDVADDELVAKADVAE